MSLTSSVPAGGFPAGRFWITWDPGAGQLAVREDSGGGRILWESPPGRPFLAASSGGYEAHESRGFFHFKERFTPWTGAQTVDEFAPAAAVGGAVVLWGKLSGAVEVDYHVTFEAIDDAQLRVSIRLGDGLGEGPRVLLRCASAPDERFFGFGEQFTHADLKGRQVLGLSQEPGIGRGVQPVTWFLNTFFGAGGCDTQSNAPAPHYITSRRRSLCLEDYALSRFDLRDPEVAEVEVWDRAMTARIFRGDTPADLVEAYTRFSGRMAELPAWIHRGAIVGMQGGTSAARAMVERLDAAGAPIAALWLQDWVGARKTAAGSQLWWNWELDHARYPGWDDLREALAARGARLMSYVNPFLVDVSGRDVPCRRNLFQEALEAGYLIQRADGSPYLVMNTSFSAAMVDLTNPEARAWLKEVLREQVLGAGVSGWMADFGEALPFDAKLHDGSDAAVFHNQYPEAWARLNREVLQEAGAEGEVAFFARSGFSRSPGLATMFWLGDQLTSWRAEDGIKSGVTGLLSSGFSGFSQNHSDIGGYTTTAIPGSPVAVPFFDHRRSRELLWRWIELNAFTAVFRTHEGNQPGVNYQIDRDPETLAHFARFARVYAALAPIRVRLGREAAARGLPVMRHMWLAFPDDPVAPSLAWQFALGPLVVAPVLDPGTDRVRLYLPAGRWRHLWTGAAVEGGRWITAAAPLGAPAVFSPAGDAEGEALHTALADDRPAMDPGAVLLGGEEA